MRARSFIVMALLLPITTAALPGFSQHQPKNTISDRKTANDGKTVGWLILSSWPDQTETSQAWRKIAGTLVIAQSGKVIRRIEGGSTIWTWSFWNGAKQVAYQTGGMHGVTTCILIDVKTGRELEQLPQCNSEDNSRKLPEWVKVALAEN